MEEKKKTCELHVIVYDNGNVESHIEGKGIDVLAAYSCLTSNVLDSMTKEHPEVASVASQTLLGAYSIGVNTAMEEIQKKEGK